MVISVSEFKAKFTQILRELAVSQEVIEVTSRGKVVAVVSPPEPEEVVAASQFLGCLRGTVTYKPGWDEPLGEMDWEAAQ